MGRKLSLAIVSILLFAGFGCSGGEGAAKDSHLDAPTVAPVPESKSQQERGISPEVARGMAEPGLAGKR